jgi:ATP-dependent Lhr-like helicase
VILVDGSCGAFLERGARSLITFAEDDAWIEGLVSLAKDGRTGKLTIHRINGVPAAESNEAAALRASGFVETYRGLTLRT